MSAPHDELHGSIACQVQQNWDWRAVQFTHPPNVQPFLSVSQGELAWAFRVLNGFVYIRLRRDIMLRGWVPQTLLLKGSPRQIPTPIQLSIETYRSAVAVSGGAGAATQSVLYKTLQHLWKTIADNRDNILRTIPGLPEAARNVVFHRSSGSYGDAVYKCIVPEVRAFLDSGTFDVANLAKFPGVTSTYPPPMKPGVYFRVYGDFGGTTFGNQNFQVAHYVGQTVNMQHRDEQHRSSTYGGKKSNHYRIARKAGKTAAVPIILQKDMPLPSSFLDIAEFSVTCLFESWYPILLHPTNMNTVGSYGVDFDAATLFAQLAKSAAKETGWNPKHTSFGLNWNTPIVKNGCAEQKWVSWFDPSKNMYMYRSRRTIRHSTDGLEIYWASKTKIVVPKELENAAGLRDGQAVHVVAELARNSEGSYRPHQFRFVRFPPSIGLNPELEKLSSLAVKIEWLDSNQWKSAYLEQSKIWATLPNPHRSVLQIHRKVLMMMSDITEVGYTNAPQWVVSRPTSVVQFLDYDHLGQKMVVKRVQPREIPWPRDWTVAENVARLRTRFPPNRFPEVVIGPRPTTQGFFGSHSTRSACDFCYTQYTTVACRYTHATTSCQCCRTLNRPCTWTGGDDAKTRLAQGGDLEELGIALNFTRLEGSRITTLPKAPFDPDLESEEHTPVI